jgi:hypothetical protein
VPHLLEIRGTPQLLRWILAKLDTRQV